MFEYVLNNVPSMIYLFNSSRMIRRKSNPMVAFASNSSYLRKEHGFDTCLSTNNKLWKLRCSQRSERATSQNCPRQLADPSGRRLQFWESSFTARGSSSSSLYLPLSLSLSPSLSLSLSLISSRGRTSTWGNTRDGGCAPGGRTEGRNAGIENVARNRGIGR